MLEVSSECRRLEQLVKRYERGDLQHIEWLDGLAFRSLDRLRAEVRFSLDL